MPWTSQRRTSVFNAGGPSIPTLGGGTGGFSGGSGGAGGSLVGVSDPALDEFVTGPFIQPPPGAATSGTSSLQRAFPERIGGNLLASPGMEPGIMEHAMQGIGRIGAQPVALADTILGGAITKAATDIDEGVPIIGDILGFGADVVHNVFTLPAAIMNSHPSQVMSRIWNKGDDTEITPELLASVGLKPDTTGFKKNGLPVLGWLGITGENMTIGELKRELEGRGFLHAEGDPSISISWEEFAAQVKGDPLGSFKQGHAAVNEDGLADFALQSIWQTVETLPVGLAASLIKAGVAGGAGIAARMTGLGARSIAAADEVDAAAAGVGAIARGAGVTTPVWGFTVKGGARLTGQVGDGAVNQMVESGVINRVATEVAEQGVELAAGSARGATLAGWANFARGALYPNIPRLNPLGRYMVGQTGVRAASLGIEGGTSILENVIAGEDGSNVPLISNMHDFFEAVNNNTIVSDDMVFSTVLAFNFPVVAAARQVAKPVTAPLGRALDVGRANTLNRSLDVLEREFGAGTIEALGGRKAAAIWMDKMAQTLAFERVIRGLPTGVKTMWESLPEATLRMRLIHNTIRSASEFHIRSGRITASDLVTKFREVHERPVRTHIREDGSILREEVFPFQTRLSTDAIVRRANAYAAASKGITDPIVGMQTMVLGRAPRMAKEDLEFAIKTLEDAAIDGKVDAQFIRDLFYETPGMLDDPFVSEGTHNFFVEAMNPGRNEMFDVADVVGRLKELDPPTRDQLWHELKQREQAAPQAVNGDNGLVTNGVARNIHSEETARRFVQEADARVRNLTKKRATLMERYRSMFSKRGRYKPSQSDQNWDTASAEVAKTMSVSQVGHFSQVSGKPRNYQRGFDVPGRRLGIIPEGDSAGLVEAARAVREQYPGADVRLTPSATHPGHLDVTGSYHFTNEVRAQAKAAELGSPAYFDSSKRMVPRVPTNPVTLVPKPIVDAKIAEIIDAMPGITPDQAPLAAELLRTYAQSYVRYNGGSPIDYLDNISFVRGGRRGAGALRQTDILFTDAPPPPSPGITLRRNRNELQPILDQPAPAALQKAGMGDAAPLEWHTLTNGEDFAIPGGLDGEFSLWDAWRLRSQQVDPNLIPEPLRASLYEKLFRSQQRELNNPVDVWNRIAFAHISPNMNLLANETGLAAMRATSLKGIKQIADTPLEELYARLQTAGSASIPLRQQLRSLQVNARRFSENPEWFKIRDGEGTLEYSERVMSVLDGAGMKVGNFSTMLADPLRHNRGTIDSHMIAILNKEGLLEPDMVTRLKATSDAPIAPSTRLVSLKVRGKDNPAVPEHLRNLPWQRSDGKVAIFDGDYRITSEALDRHLAQVHPDLPFASGGGQWYLWDLERGIVEPHTAIWPGSENLAAMAPEAIGKAKAAIKQAGYYSKSGNRGPFDPNEGVFWQLGEGGATKGSIEWAAGQKAIIRGYQSADLSTFVHEMGHQIRRDLHPEDQLIVEGHYGVREGKWTVKHEERFAREFERYLRDGLAPTAALRDVFAKIATWMRDIYKTLKGTPLEAKIAPEVRAIFDRALGKIDEAARIEMPPTPLPRRVALTPAEAATAFATVRSKSRAIVNYTRKNGGATFDPVTGTFHETGGFGVGVVDGTFRKVDPKDTAAVTAAMEAVVMEHPGTKVGTWLDDQGVLHVDPSEVVTSLDDAMALASSRGQEAIWDFTNATEIKVPPRAAAAPALPDFDPYVFEKEDAALLAKREQMRTEVRDTDAMIARTKQDIREVRARAKALKGGMNSLDDSFTELNADGTPRVTGADLQRVTQYTNWVRENYPQFEIESGPRIMNLYQPDSSLLKNLMLENDATGQFLFSWGPLTRMHNAIKAATEAAIRPVRGRVESRDTTSRIYEVLMAQGAKQDEIKTFLQNVSDVLLNERTVGLRHEQIPITRGMNAMGARQLTQQAISAFNRNTDFIAKFEQRYGGSGLERMYVPIAEAYNPVIRAIQRKIEQGGPVNKAQRLMESAYDAYHTQPGFASLSLATHTVAKWVYPLVRFTMNPLYHLYNSTEADIIALTQDGMRVRRGRGPTSAEVFDTVERGNVEAYAGLAHQKRRMEAMGLDPALDAYTDELIRNATLDQTGVTMGYNSRRAALMERQVDLRRPETITDAIRQFASEDPAIQAALKRYGGSADDWVDGLTQDIYGIDKNGARKYIGDLLTEEGWTREEFAAMEPLITEVTNRMQKSFDDIYELHVGNINRSRIERVMNSYWLFWPASYMLKANKWMFKVLTEGAFGRRTNAGGAWTLNELSKEYHERYVRDEEFRKLVDDNDDLLFLMSSILPVAPWSDGVSLNRLTRYVGGHVGLWPQYTNFDPVDVPSWSSKMSEIGPIYSMGLVGDVTEGLSKTVDLQGLLNLAPDGSNTGPLNPQAVPGM